MFKSSKKREIKKLHLVVSDSKEMYKKACKCIVVVLPILTVLFAVLVAVAVAVVVTL